jgi:hypothetical protein
MSWCLDRELVLSSLAPHAHGYACEAFLKDLFDSLAAQNPFHLRSVQIDGSFQLGHETYLVEGKVAGARR